MIIDCISDLHGYYPEMSGGDLLIVAGDLTKRDDYKEYLIFFSWIAKTKYRKKIVIAGNHDNLAQKDNILTVANGDFEYLCDSATEFEGLKFWGSPWTKSFPSENPKCKAFTVDTEEELGVKFSFIPEDTDILITHAPPKYILDKNIFDKPVGSIALINRMTQLSKIKYHIFGHIHENFGQENIVYKENDNEIYNVSCLNVSYVNENYEPVHNPVRIIIP